MPPRITCWPNETDLPPKKPRSLLTERESREIHQKWNKKFLEYVARRDEERRQQALQVAASTQSSIDIWQSIDLALKLTLPLAFVAFILFLVCSYKLVNYLWERRELKQQQKESRDVCEGEEWVLNYEKYDRLRAQEVSYISFPNITEQTHNLASYPSPFISIPI